MITLIMILHWALLVVGGSAGGKSGGCCSTSWPSEVRPGLGGFNTEHPSQEELIPTWLVCRATPTATEERSYMETRALKRDTGEHEKEPQDQSKHRAVFVREYKPADNAQVLSIFCDGLMEMIPDTAFRALRHHPESLLLYSAVTGEVAPKYRCRQCFCLLRLISIFFSSMKLLIAFQFVSGCPPALMVPIDLFFSKTRYLKFPFGCRNTYNMLKPFIVWLEKCGIWRKRQSAWTQVGPSVPAKQWIALSPLCACVRHLCV